MASLRSTHFAIALAATLALTACGTRTPLDIHRDGSVTPGRDGGIPDARLADRIVPPDTSARCTSDADCDDGLMCTGREQCIGGRCVPSMGFVCTDELECTDDVCIEGSGCTAIPNDDRCPPGMFCDVFRGCTPRPCGSDFDCDDGLFCNGVERCDAAAAVCVSGPPPVCDDGTDCTDDFCVEPGGCRSDPNPMRCPPGSMCLPGVGCVGGRCRRDSDCDDGRVCNGAERCMGGACAPGAPLACADMIDCTRDTCSDFAGGCTSTPDSALCPMGMVCDVMVGCQIIPCRTDAACSDGVFCNGAERCVGGRCTAGTAPSCDDGQTCTIDRCEPGIDGCINEPRSMIENCTNRIDDNCDGLVDCADPTCRGNPACGCRPTADFEVFCDNGLDEDCDGALDCADMDCAGRPPCARTETICNDGRDDDGDGLIDCRDPDCAFAMNCRDGGAPRDAGRPRDGGRVDAGRVTAEIGVAACTNGIDDDRDGRTDCADPDCRPFGGMSECCNGIDDDGDGNADIFTCRCFMDSTCVGVGDLEQTCWESSFSVCAPRCNFYGGHSFCRMFFMDSLPRCDFATGECMP